MTIHNRIEKKRWQAVKAKVIARFGTITAAARKLRCHPNSIRYSQSGLCPEVKAKLEKEIPELVEAAND